MFATCLTSEGADKLQGACSDRVTTLLLDVTDEKSIAAARHFVESRLPAGTGQTHQSGSQCFILRLFIIPVWIAGRHRSDPPVSQSVFYSASVHYTNLDCRQTQASPTSQSVSVLYCICSLYQVGLPADTGQTYQSVNQCFILCLFVIPSWIAGRHRSEPPVSQCFILRLFIIPSWIAGRLRSDPPVSQSVFSTVSVHYYSRSWRLKCVGP